MNKIFILGLVIALCSAQDFILDNSTDLLTPNTILNDTITNFTTEDLGNFPTNQTVMRAAPASFAVGDVLSEPQSNLTQQQLLARFASNTVAPSSDTSQQEIQSNLSAEGATQIQIAQGARSLLPAQTQSLISSNLTARSTQLSSIFNFSSCFFKRGLTWRKKQHTCSNGLEVVGCVGCNPYTGDTQCYQLRPILCIYRAQDTRPDYPVSTPFYQGWSGGHIKITKPIRGCYIFSKAHADFICRTEFGFGWGIASHHDGHYIPGMNGMNYAYGTWNWSISLEGGWNFFAYGNLSVTPYNSYWTYIRNQPGNCWN